MNPSFTALHLTDGTLTSANLLYIVYVLRYLYYIYCTRKKQTIYHTCISTDRRTKTLLKTVL